MAAVFGAEIQRRITADASQCIDGDPVATVEVYYKVPAGSENPKQGIEVVAIRSTLSVHIADPAIFPGLPGIATGTIATGADAHRSPMGDGFPAGVAQYPFESVGGTAYSQIHHKIMKSGGREADQDSHDYQSNEDFDQGESFSWWKNHCMLPSGGKWSRVRHLLRYFLPLQCASAQAAGPGIVSG
jgi:hypothetical protein